MAAPLIPWEPCNFPSEITDELERRKQNRSFNYTQWEGDEWKNYKGPMSPWVRFCSNGAGPQFGDAAGKEGFVLCSGKNFYADYGFNKENGTNEGIIGYLPDGTPHTIKNDLLTSNYPIHVPPPEIEKISVSIQKELFRRAEIEWVCFSKKQLEYMTPYFLVPGITCILEWGWNHFDAKTLLPLDNVDVLKKLNDNPYPLYTNYILKSKGNYDVLFGKVTHFEWTIDGNKIRCKTEITSQDRIYAGLVLDAAAVPKKGDKVPLDGLHDFVSNTIPRFKELKTKSPEKIDANISKFCQYLKAHEKSNYIYGVYWGRDKETPTVLGKGNDAWDFDLKTSQHLWLSMGLVMEIINYHASIATTVQGQEMFRVDIDDCVVGAHQNMISSDGSILLIPNAKAPHYFYGEYGLIGGTSRDEYNTYLKNSTETLASGSSYANARLYEICKPLNDGKIGGVKRDNLDAIINELWIENGAKNTAFPFLHDIAVDGGGKAYPQLRSGYLKNLYFSYEALLNLVNKDSSVKTYTQLIDKILERINRAAGNFWDFRLIGNWGGKNLPDDEPAAMKIVDYKFMSTANKGTVYTFDYMDADSLLLGMDFKPTLSNAQAIRTIYSPTNNPDSDMQITNGEDELLDYKFKDRLMKDQTTKTKGSTTYTRDPKVQKFTETMQLLQQKQPTSVFYQVTNEKEKHVYRLVLPDPSVLKLLLDDGDSEGNPKYTGIMPGIQATFTIQGVGGLRTFMCFLVRNLPEPYSHKSIIFRITDLKEAIENGKWTTTIVAGVIPLRKQIRDRLGIPA